jgi:hypothetical protein
MRKAGKCRGSSLSRILSKAARILYHVLGGRCETMREALIVGGKEKMFHPKLTRGDVELIGYRHEKATAKKREVNCFSKFQGPQPTTTVPC